MDAVGPIVARRRRVSVAIIFQDQTILWFAVIGDGDIDLAARVCRLPECNIQSVGFLFKPHRLIAYLHRVDCQIGEIEIHSAHIILQDF